MKELKDEINFKKNLIGEIENIKERLGQGADFMEYKNDFMIKLVDIKDRYVVSERKIKALWQESQHEIPAIANLYH